MQIGPSLFEGVSKDVSIVQMSVLGKRWYAARGSVAVKSILGNSSIRIRIPVGPEASSRLRLGEFGLFLNSNLGPWRMCRKLFAEGIGNDKFLKGVNAKLNEYMAVNIKLMEKAAGTATPVLVNELGRRITLDIIMDVTFSEKRGSATSFLEDVNEGREIQPDSLFVMARGIMDANSFYNKVPPLVFKHVLTSADKMHTDSVDQFVSAIEERVSQKQKELGEVPEIHQGDFDFATSLFAASKSLPEESRMNFVVCMVRETIAGGTDSTSNAIAYLIYELARNQDIADAICAQIVEVAGPSGAIDSECLKKLTLLEASVFEITRLYAIAPNVRRYITEDVIIDNVLLKKDSDIIITLGMNMHDPLVWETPETFDPTRFLNKLSKPEGPYGFGWNYSPFGYGVRKCPGEDLAVLELKLVIAYLCRRFRFILANPNEPLEITDSLFRECGPLPIIFEQRVEQ
ncbi:cytochrome P450 [Rhizoclosmatium globosum]|uniref:Cytochrome P450 n=1 Tax=Rhizoclosmatium globosum TaxID=329046 RepID=A0A1Y2D357_9FUNG|nr:cytochrome P450 [Rhizoclosmatium globosum]|eukprot:ORY53690.1 cytochrome P450 [Rhizoclosmatium globosum]